MVVSRFALRLSIGIRKIAGDRRGTSAIEFAMIVPIFAAVVIPLADVANFAAGVSQMQTAVRSSIQYAMLGGTDMNVAQSQGLTAWPNRPAGGTLTAAQACFCSGTAADCNTACADGTPPQSYVTVTASATFRGNAFSTQRGFTEKVRVR